MTKTKTSGTKASGIIACIVAVIMTFSIFMFFMDPLGWTNAYAIEKDYATPSFFNVMFGGGGSEGYHFVYNANTGMIFIFIIQILIILGCIASLIVIKKGNTKIGYLVLAGVGVLALTNGILTLCCSNFNISSTWESPFGNIIMNLKEDIKLAYGAYVYGITMIVCALGSFLPYGIKYCLKK